MKYPALWLILAASVLACPREVDVPPPGQGNGVVIGGNPGNSVGDGGTTPDGGVGDGGVAISCTPSLTGTCPSGTYCGCADPGGTGSNCTCVEGKAGDPCPSGSAQCTAGTLCRWYDSYFWGKCGTGVTGDVCDPAGVQCQLGHQCNMGCIWGLCCD